MKKIFLFATVAIFLLAGTAMAESIKGKFGVTARGGATYMFDSEWTDQMTASWNAAYHGILEKDIKAGWGWTVGGGIMYGITDNLAVEFDVIYLQTKLEASGYMRDLERQTRTDRESSNCRFFFGCSVAFYAHKPFRSLCRSRR
jgi:opacity protein-like surface antigen